MTQLDVATTLQSQGISLDRANIAKIEERPPHRPRLRTCQSGRGTADAHPELAPSPIGIVMFGHVNGSPNGPSTARHPGVGRQQRQHSGRM